MGPLKSRQTAGPTIALGPKPSDITLTKWLYDELRSAILSGRLRRRARVPASRELAATHGLSRRIVVNVFEQLRDEGYLTSHVGVGTLVSEHVPDDYSVTPSQPPPALTTDRTPTFYRRPARPFRPMEPALSEFPLSTWTRVTARTLRRLPLSALAGSDPAGSAVLREAIAAYLGASRGVTSSPDNIVIVSGAQQGLDLLARIVIQPDDAVWVEDPGYVGAVQAFRNAGAKIVPVRVDDNGLDPREGRRLCAKPKAVYLTPAHQFALGTQLSLERRFELLRWARRHGTVLIEDDYDSEFRFTGRPVPAMKGLDGSDSVFLIGSFNKVMFPSLRLGYMVVPDAWIDRVLTLRFQSDRYPAAMPQAILARFIEEGHLVRHLRRMRELYGRRRAALTHAVDHYLSGALTLPDVPAGLSTPAYLLNGMSSAQASRLATKAKLEAWPLDQFALKRRDLRGLMLGFAAFTEREIDAGVQTLAKALATAPSEDRGACSDRKPISSSRFPKRTSESANCR